MANGERNGPDRRSYASMSLLRRLLEGSLDTDYTRAAARRKVGKPPRWFAQALLFSVLTGVGVFASVAVVQAREQPITNDQRERLIEAIEDRTARTDDLRLQAIGLRQRIAQMRVDELAKSEKGQQTRERLRELELATGAIAVEGPGLTVTLDDAPPGEEGFAGSPPSFSRVHDYDVQRLVDALWAAGAEAIAVDGQRLTPLTAIRSAGKAILVNYRPISPPYVVTAIGDPDVLRTELADSDAGRRFHTLQANLGIRFDTERHGWQDHLRLPGGSGLALRYAREVDEVDRE